MLFLRLEQRERNIHNFNIFMPLIREVPRARELLSQTIKIGQRTIVT